MERKHEDTHRQLTEHERRWTGTAAFADREEGGVKLVPPGPPGRITRKARDFEGDIVQLRAQGYTLDAIRQALEAAGVQVSVSTVRRESLRGGRAVPSPLGTSSRSRVDLPGAVLQDADPVGAPGGVVNDTASPAWLKGRDVAEAYMRDHITNPLSRAKEKR